ncbi:MAG: DUF1295 domain-containing protein [Dehalococcoidia bacterium]|nr:DUF1295 domain-containing protein [Dehalococcoidia bacterium]
MSEEILANWLLLGWIIVALAIGVLLFFVNAPYGRYLRTGWGPTFGARQGWLVMESAAALWLVLFFVLGSAHGPVSWIFLLMWEVHYVHRAFIYPFTLPRTARQMPLSVVTMGLAFNSVNAYLNGRHLFTFSAEYTSTWLHDPRFILGLFLFATGYIINRWADHTLRRLRRTTDTTYAVPHGGLYRWVSCPNYLGEIIIWIGWAIATWSLPGLAFAIWTIANLAPRARANHDWYRSHFPNYPRSRRALLPRIW